MSRITVSIGHLLLKGFEASDKTAVVQGFEAELSRILSDKLSSNDWAHPRRTPVLRLGRMPFESGPSVSRKFGGGIARAIGKELKHGGAKS